MKHLADGHSVVKKVLEFVVSIGSDVQCFPFQVKKVVKGEARKRRKDQGKFKKPMAAVLTGLNVKGREDFVEELVEGEVRPLDCAESILKEAATVLQPSSGTSEAEETIVECNRGKGDTFEEDSHLPQEDVLGVVMRPANATKHFSKMWAASETDTDTDMDGPCNVDNSQILPRPAIDFSKFMKR